MEQTKVTFTEDGKSTYDIIKEAVELWNERKGDLTADDFWGYVAHYAKSDNPFYPYIMDIFDFSSLVDEELKDKFKKFSSTEEFSELSCNVMDRR